MRKSLMFGIVTLLAVTVLSGMVLAKKDKTTGALAITTNPSRVLVSVKMAGGYACISEASLIPGTDCGIITEKYSPFWIGNLASRSYIVTATFGTGRLGNIVTKTVKVIAGRTVPVHLSAKKTEEGDNGGGIIIK